MVNRGFNFEVQLAIRTESDSDRPNIQPHY